MDLIAGTVAIKAKPEDYVPDVTRPTYGGTWATRATRAAAGLSRPRSRSVLHSDYPWRPGEVAERLMAALLKSAESKDFVGSNPTLSAIAGAGGRSPRPPATARERVSTADGPPPGLCGACRHSRPIPPPAARCSACASDRRRTSAIRATRTAGLRLPGVRATGCRVT